MYKEISGLGLIAKKRGVVVVLIFFSKFLKFQIFEKFEEQILYCAIDL